MYAKSGILVKFKRLGIARYWQLSRYLISQVNIYQTCWNFKPNERTRKLELSNMADFQELAGRPQKIIWMKYIWLTTVIDNYQRCYGKTSLKFGSKPALIVIDVCKAYHDPTSPLYAPERFDTAVKSVINLIEKCRSVGIPVIFTSVLYENGNGGKWYSEKLPTVLCSFDKGNPYRDFADGVQPTESEVVITKQYASSFFGTTLSSLLTSWRIDSTILCGYSTSGCVRATGTLWSTGWYSGNADVMNCSSWFHAIWIQPVCGERCLWG